MKVRVIAQENISHKKNWEKVVRLTAWGGGWVTPLSLTTSICENFDPFFVP